MRGLTLLGVTVLVSAFAPWARGEPPSQAAMLELAERSRCLNCHEVDQRVRGPAWREVARRYRGDAAAEERLVQKVYEGGGGVWGDDYMSANRRAGLDNIRLLVRWILSLE